MAADINFNQQLMLVRVPQPGATAVISGTWHGPEGSGFSLTGFTPSGHKDALGTSWQTEQPKPASPGTPEADGKWAATVRFYHTGTINLTVTLTAPGTPPVLAEAKARVVVEMDAAAPDLLVLQPQPNPALPVEPGGQSLPLQVQSRSDLGPRTVSWHVQETNGGSATNGLGTNLWTGPVGLAPMPLGAQPLTVTVTCTEAPDVTQSVTVPLVLVDRTGPDLVFNPPLPPGNALSATADSNGRAQLPFVGTVSDAQSGVASLTSTPGGAIPIATGGNWSATLTLSLGTQQVTFVATDNAGNATTVTVIVTVMPQAHPVSVVMQPAGEATPSGTSAMGVKSGVPSAQKVLSGGSTAGPTSAAASGPSGVAAPIRQQLGTAPGFAPAASVLPSITVNPVQNALAGVPITVTGSVTGGSQGGSGDPYTLDSISVQVGSASPVTPNWAGGGLWSATVTFPWPGRPTLAATLTYEDNLGRKAKISSVPTVTVGDQPVSLAVVSPATSASLTYQLQVNASSPIGVGLVAYSVDAGRTWSALTTSDGTHWSAAVPLPVTNPVDPKSGHTVPLVVGGFDNAQAPASGASIPVPPSQQTVQVTSADTTRPTVTWQAPPDKSIVEVIGGGTPTAQTTVTATVTDDAGGVVSAGLPASPITCSVDGGTPVSLGQISGGDPGLWQANVTLAGLGAHTLTLVCTDNAGNVNTQTKTLTVREAGALTTTAQDYLADLLDYAGNRILTSPPPGGRSVTPLDLSDTLCEPFLDLAGAGGRPRVPADQALAPINAVRGVIEVLRSYLAPQPAGHWALNEGTGTIAHDDTGHGCDGILISAPWGPGRVSGTAAPVFDGASSYVQVGAIPQLDLRGGELTIAAWVNPSAPGSAVVAGRDQSYGLARINGTLQWILAMPSPGWAYHDTGAAVPQGQWSHVAVSYDGANVRAFLNGTPVSTIAASGPITPNSSAGGDFRIGCQQTGSPLFFSGSIADVAVYAHALSQYDVQLLAGTTPAATTTWLNGALPPDAQIPPSGNEGFTWTTGNPAPFSASSCHQSPLTSGVHQHYFLGIPNGWPVDRIDQLYTYVYLDPNNPPSEVMLQWFDQAVGWNHRAFWGDDLIDWGTAGTSSRHYMGSLPPAGQWVRLDVMAASVGLEWTTVTGLAFTLYGGQAWWDVSAKAAGIANLANCSYPAVAYQALLGALGTSLEELREARGAPPVARTALASRLGITLSQARPDELDQLLLPLSTVTEADLEQLFGLQRTDIDPLAGSLGMPALLAWQEARLRTQWALEDHATTSPTDYTSPIIDPDIVTTTDLLNPAAGQPAFDLWQARTTWVQGQTQGLQQLRASQPTPAASLNAMLTQTLPGFDLQGTAAKLADGYDITATLAQELLDLAGFNRLLTLSTLAAIGPLTDDEWDDACAILAQVLKTRQFPAWRQNEQTAGLLLDPAVFTAAPVPPQLPLWRATAAARLQWQDRLAARTDQLANLQAGLGSAIAAAEQAALPILRDAALAIAAPDDPGTLSGRLCVDLQAGPQLTTTRLDRAAEAMQGLFAGIDAGGSLSAIGVAWVVPVPSGYTDLDSVLGELSWMSQYSSWLAAMNVFLYPENHVLPTTWPTSETTPAFQDFLTALAGLGPGALTEQGARQLAAGYWNDSTWNGPPAWPVSPAPPGYPLHITPPSTTPDPWPQHAASGPAAQQYPYEERLSEADLAALRDKVQAAQFHGYGSFTAIPAWLRELFFDLPMQLALSLAQSGQWRGALGWLRVTYDRAQPAPVGGPDQRQIFAGFALEPATETITRDENWLNGGQLDPHTIAGERARTYLRFTLITIAGVLCDWADTEFSTDTDESRAVAASLYRQALDTLSAPELIPAPGLAPNPELTALTSRAAVNLTKLRSGLNIAGLTRPLVGTLSQVTAVVVPPPTSYRYATLVARAQQLITLAAQMEASYLASLEKQDNENYQQLLAQQDLNVAGAHVTIANEQATIATDEVGVAQLQVQRAQTQSDTYASWISGGPNQYEQDQLTQIGQEQQYRAWASAAQVAGAVAQAAASACSIDKVLGAIVSFGGAIASTIAAGAFNATAAGFSGAAEQAALSGQADALQASWERRQDEWNLQKQLADADVAIGKQQVTISQARAQVASDEAALATLTQTNAVAKLSFLQTKLTNAALYQWMAGVLGSVYRYLLQRAAATARLAEQQLAFERQAAMPGYIKTDYWTAPGGGSVPVTGTAGLTGSARLLEDITQLDQYAFDTNTRKVQLTQTFSLATVAPVDLQRFRDSGVLPFTIPLSSFGVPGMYLATIRTLRISIAALIPPNAGVRGTLAGGGSSDIVVNTGTGFDTVTLARPPETIVLTAPANASGVFQVDLTPELELPWEGCGLDIPLEFRLPKAINPFDYRTIADVQISIDYTALYSPDYAARVIRELPSRTSNSLAINLSDFTDNWYQLVTQAQTAAQATPTPTDPLLAQWPVTADMFPSNLSDLAVEQIALFALRTASTELGIDHLQLNGLPAGQATAATTVGHIVSTRNGSGAAWNTSALIGASPVGTWEVGLVADLPTIQAVAGGDVQDLVLVITYGGSVPAWPT